jgi:hypothetical protein
MQKLKSMQSPINPGNRPRGLYLYPWSVADTDDFVSRILDLGISHVSVAASYHAGKFICPSDTSSRVYFPEDGVVYFRPRSPPTGLLQPRVSELTAARDVLEELCEHGGVGVRAWMVLNHNTRLGLEHPGATTRNAFGDSYPYSLCPSNTEVRNHAVSLCRDLAANYDVECLLLESPGWMVYSHGYHHEFAMLPANAWLDGMLGLCFCDHCLRGTAAAGMDAAGLRRRVRERIDAFLAGPIDPDVEQAQSWIERDRQTDPDLDAFLAWRCTVVTGLCRDIRRSVREGVGVKVISTCQRPHATMYWEGGDPAALLDAGDGLELPLYQPSAAAVEDDARYVIGKTARTDRLSAILRPGYPDMLGEEQVVDTLRRLTALGVADISFYNYSMLRPANLAWLRHALAREQ